uniref:Vacuolar protein sortingassociated protein 53 putat n=1 Tax=Albugo laibachii Nc14 TaxID=890382 RepID=F0WSG8_9STRA|nr:vacuolar protein sortingassociated protein 53 putat [Albugo laibachii Nc14]|eukprot:CCA24290.1 vacuolar protein sortingassociated protein 53 putat [Albugo laibachii Nc14]
MKKQNPAASAFAPARLSSDVENELTKTFPSEDVLDRPEFDARDFINRNFPDEPSLSDISPFANQLRIGMKELDDQLSKASQAQRLAAHQATVDLKDAKVAVTHLLDKIQDIHGKAHQSEVMVQDICRDIKQLDHAKQHLQATLTTLKRLHALVQAVDQLELKASQRSYTETATLLQSVNELFAHFDAYTNVHKIVELHSTVRGLQEELKAQVFADFSSVGSFESIEDTFPSKTAMQAVLNNLSAACAVVDALGKPTRTKLVHVFCQDQLSSYEKLYGDGGELAALEQAEKRFSWFYQLLRAIGPRLEVVFPKPWQIERRLCIFFCEITRNHLLNQLGNETPDEINVMALLKALQRSLLFEKDAAARFEGNASVDGGDDEIDETGEIISRDSAEAIKRKYRRKKLQADEKGHHDVKPGSNALNQDKQQSDSLDCDQDLPTIVGFISRSFDPFMTAYVQLERKNMAQMITDGIASEIVDRNGQLPVFSSSVGMFAYIRNSVQRCTVLTNGQTFFNLQNEFKRCFQLYSQRMSQKLPAYSNSIHSTNLAAENNSSSNSSVATSSSHNGSLGSSSSKNGLSVEKLEELCFVINTAQYCAETLPSLEDVIRQKIDPAFSKAIDLSAEIDIFHDVAAASMKCVVAGVERLLDDSLQAIPKLNWQSWETVGDENSYVVQIGQQVRLLVPIIRQMLAQVYFVNFYDKFTASFIPKILQAIMKCRKVNQVATQQLLLDVCALKSLFLQLPVLVTDSSSFSGSTDVPARFTKFVTQEFGKIEAVLKLIGTPNEMLIESFKIMWPDGSPEDLQAIMNIKGFRKQDQSSYLEILGKQGRSLGKIANMEKMNDMTESLKKNMQHFAKVPFPFHNQ